MLSPRTVDYLETIYLLSLEQDTVGVSQVAAQRDVTIPTARSAILRLRKAGLVRQERYGKIDVAGMIEDVDRRIAAHTEPMPAGSARRPSTEHTRSSTDSSTRCWVSTPRPLTPRRAGWSTACPRQRERDS